MKELDTREKIITTYAEWIAFSGTRSGCPLKSREDVYPLIREPNYNQIFWGATPITKAEFGNWHQKSIEIIVAKSEKRLSVGWAVKLVNLYLKTMVYVSGYGRPELVKWIHPPIDSGLWQGIEEAYKEQKDILTKTHSKIKIKDIIEYADYQTIIDGMQMIALDRNYLLIEVEELWKGTEYKSKQNL